MDNLLVRIHFIIVMIKWNGSGFLALFGQIPHPVQAPIN